MLSLFFFKYSDYHIHMFIQTVQLSSRGQKCLFSLIIKYKLFKEISSYGLFKQPAFKENSLSDYKKSYTEWKKQTDLLLYSTAWRFVQIEANFGDMTMSYTCLFANQSVQGDAAYLGNEDTTSGCHIKFFGAFALMWCETLTNQIKCGKMTNLDPDFKVWKRP